MAATVCAFCHSKSNMTPQAAWTDHDERTGMFRGYGEYLSVISARCDNCWMAMIAVVRGERAFIDARSQVQSATTALERASETSWYPKRVDKVSYPSVPEHIARCAEEAHQAREIGAIMASILMARTTIEATAKHHNIDTKGIYPKIEKLRDEGLIRKPIADAAHEIRHLGNDMAHGDVTDQPNAQDADDVLKLLDALLSDVFEVTAITQDIIGRRAARRDQSE